MKSVHEISSTMGEKRPMTNPIIKNVGIKKGLIASREGGKKKGFFGQTQRITNQIGFYLLSNEAS